MSERAKRAHQHSALLGPKGRSVIARIPKGAPMTIVDVAADVPRRNGELLTALERLLAEDGVAAPA